MSARKQRRVRVGYDDLLEDTIGLNIRGLKTLATVILKPRRYFTAAADPDWYGLYTPSIRLWLSVVAIIFFFRFFWGAQASPLIEAMESQLAGSGLPLPEGMTYADAALEVGQLYFALSPVFMAVIYSLLGAVWPFWARKTSLPLRERFLFAAILPSTVFVLITTLLLAVVPAQNVVAFSFVSVGVSALIDAQTLFRGAYTGQGLFGRLWRAGLLAVVLTIVGVTSASFAQLAALLIVVFY